MNVKIVLSRKGLLATYHIDQVDNITFNARLREFSGETKPPAYIKLYKTGFGWCSAFDDAEFIRELGAAVDGTKN